MIGIAFGSTLKSRALRAVPIVVPIQFQVTCSDACQDFDPLLLLLFFNVDSLAIDMVSIKVRLFMFFNMTLLSVSHPNGGEITRGPRNSQYC